MIRAAQLNKRRIHCLSIARYQYDKDVYGYRTAREFIAPPLSPEELINKNTHPNICRLVQAYRENGHQHADLDPLNLVKQKVLPELDPTYYGIQENDEKIPLNGIMHIGKTVDPLIARKQASSKTIISHLRRVYSDRIGFEFEHVPSSSEKKWLAQYIESYEKKPLELQQRKRILDLLLKSEEFDHFMAKKFPQVKRYGLEGAESMMVALDSLFNYSSQSGLNDIILCMPHRGRLNLLTGILNFNSTALFNKVKGNPEFPTGMNAIGDVLSHLSISTKLDYGYKKKLSVSLLHNPSHLEAVNPVAMGKARARQMQLFDENTEHDCFIGDRVMCVQLHGDAAFTGQGVVTETLGLSNLPHFTSGGSIHLIVNNQIGYTTPAQNARSTVYTSDVAKMICAPVIHVNADFPEEVTHAMNIAFEYRNKFRKDIIVDLIAYRRWGHNELDEPAFTQPNMYKTIRARKSVPKLYEELLISDGTITSSEASAIRETYSNELDIHLKASYDYCPKLDSLQGKWSKMKIVDKPDISPLTGVSLDILKQVGFSSIRVPSGIQVHPRLQKYHIESRKKAIEEGTRLDWATGEALAFGTLLLEKFHVRISGQDVGRGTFSQRHLMLVDQGTERTIIPLNNITAKPQGKVEIANSSLSEYAVMGFETGVSWESPNRLCIWEAQFGDFFNGAQIIIDTYLASGESKWFRQSGLTLLLPHGMDGTGPEHSSCKIERFLQLCDERYEKGDLTTHLTNMQVVNPTTPAQYFHLLRRQMHREYRKPLIVVGPKLLLRHPLATSTLSEMQDGTSFNPVLIDQHAEISAKKVIFVSGKFYYDLVMEREKKRRGADVAIIRIEELCPFPWIEIESVTKKYTNASEFVWAQEEPQNQGAWSFMEPRINQVLPQKIRYIGRETCCAPATGVGSVHKAELASLLKRLFEN